MVKVVKRNKHPVGYGIWDAKYNKEHLLDVIKGLNEETKFIVNERGFDGNGVLQIIQQELKDCEVTIVEYQK